MLRYSNLFFEIKDWRRLRAMRLRRCAAFRQNLSGWQVRTCTRFGSLFGHRQDLRLVYPRALFSRHGMSSLRARLGTPENRISGTPKAEAGWRRPRPRKHLQAARADPIQHLSDVKSEF